MKQKKNQNLRVLGEQEQDETLKEIEEQVEEHKRKIRLKTITSVAVIILVIVSTYLLIHLQTYTTARVEDTYASQNAENNLYEEYGSGVLKYSKDGIAYLNQKGREIWNQPYQIKNPIVVTCEEAAAVADKGGNSIYVFDAKGLKGEIETNLPIEKLVVSVQGIVGVVLKNESSPKIICYDASGNLLIEHKASTSGLGYPMDIALSKDGKRMMISYMNVEGGKIFSKVAYYDFTSPDNETNNYQIAMEKYENVIIPNVFFMSEEVSVAIGDQNILIYEGKDVPKQVSEIKLKKEIKNVFHNQNYIGLVLKNEGKKGYELSLYNKNGKKVMSEDFTGDYNNVKMNGNQIVMYDGKKCMVVTKAGIHKFEGELSGNVLEMFPVVGVNKYIVMSANGMEVVRFVK